MRRRQLLVDGALQLQQANVRRGTGRRVVVGALVPKRALSVSQLLPLSYPLPQPLRGI